MTKQPTKEQTYAIVIKIMACTNILGDTNSNSKIYLKTSATEGYAPPIWKQAEVQGLKESRLIIRWDEDKNLVSSEDKQTKQRFFFHWLLKLIARDIWFMIHFCRSGNLV